MIEPVHPFEGGVLDGLQRQPRGAAAADALGLVEPEDRLRQRIAVGVADAADRRLEAGADVA